MNKYFSIYKTSFRQESKTIADSLTSVVSFVVIIYIFQQLWQFIYGGSGGGTLIHGYSAKMMIWYTIMAEVLMYAVNARGVTRAFGDDIKTGKIARRSNTISTGINLGISIHAASATLSQLSTHAFVYSTPSAVTPVVGRTRPMIKATT